MASKHLRTGRRLCRGLDAAKHSTVLQPSRPLASDTLGPCPSAPEIDASWRSRFTHSWEHLAASRSHGAPSKAPIATALSGSGDPTRCHGPCAGSERFVYAPSPEVGAFLPARKQFSTRTSGDPSEPRLAKNDPRNVPDRPAPPEARPIVEPGQDPLAAGAQKEGYVSLMQQIVGAVKERPVDAAAKSRLEALRSRMEEDEAKRGLTKGTVTYAQLAQILSEAKQQSVASREFLEGVAKKYEVDIALLGDVLDTVSLATEKPLRDGGKLLGLE